MRIPLTSAAVIALVLPVAAAAGAQAQDSPARPLSAHVKAPGSKMTPAEIAAFRERQGSSSAEARVVEAPKDEAWLRSVRRRLGTGEFAGNGARPVAPKSGSPRAAELCPIGDPCTGDDPNAPTSGSGYSYLSYMAQRRQVTSSACGKATVSEMSATVPGPSSYSLSQYTVADYMGETVSSGTDYIEEGKALGHFVGVPDFGRSFYSFRWMGTSTSTLPTSDQRTLFRSALKGDIRDYRTPLTAGVIELPYDIHLVGHDSWRRYEHWVIIGGWSDNNTPSVLYADSYTGYNTAATVPPKSWIGRNTMENLIGGWGYYW